MLDYTLDKDPTFHCTIGGIMSRTVADSKVALTGIDHTYLPALSIVKHAILSDESGIFMFTVYTFITSNKQKKAQDRLITAFTRQF